MTSPATERLRAEANDRRRDISVLALLALRRGTLWTREVREAIAPTFGRWPPRPDEVIRALHEWVATGYASVEVRPGVGRGGWRRNYWTLTDAGREEVSQWGNE